MVEKKSIRKSSSKKISKGQSSVEKGKIFEDEVADIFRLLGAEVTQNIEICLKKVDILAIFRLPGSPNGHRVIVECKDENKVVNQNQRVMQFEGLLKIARQSNEADSAEIITRVPWSDQAKGFAHKSGIILLTFNEKISQLINFTTYLKETVNKFESGDPSRQNEPPMGAYYVDLSAERITKKGTERIPVIEDYVHKWMLRDDSQKHLAILGEYGTGKSSWCLKLGHDLATLYLQNPGSVRIPIIFNLCDFTKTFKIESLVTSFLDEECGVTNPRFRLFQKMNEAGIFLLIFDGFDEMAVKVESDTLELNLQEIEKFATPAKSKVIITSRFEYFVSGAEEKKCLSPKGGLLATRQTEYESLKILPWDDKRVNSFLEKRVPLIKEAKQPWAYYRKQIQKIAGLSDLSRRPVLLDMIVKTLPILISSGKTINRPNLYETYLRGEIQRQKILKQRKLLLSDTVRFSLLQKLALDFHVGEILAITFTDALKHVEKVIKPPKSELEALTRDFLTGSFLIREKDEYHFSHRSILEYLIARGLMEAIEKNEPNNFSRQRLQPVVAEFLTELNPNKETLWNWIESTKSESKEDIKYLGGNAATLLCMLDRDTLARRDLSNAVIIGANLSSADLRGANLSGTVIKNVNLVKAKFLRQDLQSGRFSDMTISVCIIGKSNPKKVSFFTDDLINQMETEINLLEMHILQYTHEFYKNYEMMMVIARVPNFKMLELFKDIISCEPMIMASSIYYDEYEKLFATIPKSELDKFQMLI